MSTFYVITQCGGSDNINLKENGFVPATNYFDNGITKCDQGMEI